MLAICTSLTISCSDDDTEGFDVSGTYYGTITTNVSSKQNSKSLDLGETRADVIMRGDQVQIHIYNDDIDFSTMLDIFEDGDYVRTCLTGSEFEEMYGHMQGHNQGGQHMRSSWQNHLNNEHENGDEHFGHFDMNNHTFEHTFMFEGIECYFKGERDHQ